MINKDTSPQALGRELGLSKGAAASLKNTDSQIRLAQYASEGLDVMRKRCRRGKFHEVEIKLVAWVHRMVGMMPLTKVGVSMSMIMQKANDLASELGVTNFKANTGWFDRFRKRFNLKSITLHGEGGDVDMNSINAKMQELRQSLAIFDADHVFNMDETGLNFRSLPNTTYLHQSNARATRGSSDMAAKERITLVVAANATGSCKIPISIIGTAQQPRCFRLGACPLPYFQQASAWMDQTVCMAWFNSTFLPAVKRFTHKKVALVWDNFSGHIITSPDPQATLYFLPPNATAVAQPMDQGILAAIKRQYKTRMAAKLITFVDRWLETRALAEPMIAGCQGLDQAHPPHILDAAKIIDAIWQDLELTTIQRCFARSGLMVRDNNADGESANDVDTRDNDVEETTDNVVETADAQTTCNDVEMTAIDIETEHEDALTALVAHFQQSRLFEAASLAQRLTSTNFVIDSFMSLPSTPSKLRPALRKWIETSDDMLID
eukprot:c12520_g1_i1.p1 GENE.c12520_g1_i1~~c12520_g1_i1.p1  ORF type:complete len:547 (+),score=89.49 c12520_g1_i1:163-1641(+)